MIRKKVSVYGAEKISQRERSSWFREEEVPQEDSVGTILLGAVLINSRRPLIDTPESFWKENKNKMKKRSFL